MRAAERVRGVLAFGDTGGGAFWGRVVQTAAANVSFLVLGLVSAVLTARLLGPDGRGTLAVMLTIGSLGIQFGTLGLPAANTYFVASDRRRLPALLGVTLLCGLGVGGAVSVGIIGFARLVPSAFALPDPLLFWAVAWIPLGIVVGLLRNLLLGLDRVRLYNGLQVVQKVVGVAAMVVLALVGWVSPLSFYLSLFVLLAGAVLVGAFVVVRESEDGIRMPRRDLLRAMGTYGVKAYAAGLLGFLVLHFDVLMVASMLGETEAGLYSIAARMGEMVYMLPASLGTILFARVSSMESGRWAFTKRTTLLTGGLLLPILGAVALLAEPGVRLLFGAEYLPAVPALLWLLPGIYLLSVNTVLMNYFAGMGMPPITVISPAIASSANIVANLYLIPAYGIAGAAVSSTVAYGMMLVSSLVYLNVRRSRRTHAG